MTCKKIKPQVQGLPWIVTGDSNKIRIMTKRARRMPFDEEGTREFNDAIMDKDFNRMEDTNVALPRSIVLMGNNLTRTRLDMVLVSKEWVDKWLLVVAETYQGP